MFEQLIQHFAGLAHWKLGLIATGMLLQGAIFSPFPEEVILLTVGILWGQDKITFFEGLVYNCLGLVPGNLLPMVLGSRYGARLLKRRPFCWIASPEGVEHSLRHFKGGKGDWIIFITRFTPFVRGPAYFASGLAKMTITRFLVVDTVAAVLQTSLMLVAGRKMGEHSESIFVAYQRVGEIMAALLVGGVIYGLFNKKRTPPCLK